MKKKLIIISVIVVLIIAIVGIILIFNKNKNKDNTNLSQQTTTISEQTTTSEPPPVSEPTVLSTSTVAKNDQNTSFESTKIDNENPIDKGLSNIFNEADTTLKIYLASESYYNAWKNEFENIATTCREDNVFGFSHQEFQKITEKAENEMKKAQVEGAGSENAASAIYSAGSVYKQGTYYFAQFYKKHMGRDYKYLYDV